jgi:hypothetical protein
MNRSRAPSKLSDSVHHQLNMYALAASAAGVGILALAQTAEAKIIYTPTIPAATSIFSSGIRTTSMLDSDPLARLR